MAFARRQMSRTMASGAGRQIQKTHVEEHGWMMLAAPRVGRKDRGGTLADIGTWIRVMAVVSATVDLAHPSQRNRRTATGGRFSGIRSISITPTGGAAGREVGPREPLGLVAPLRRFLLHHWLRHSSALRSRRERIKRERSGRNNRPLNRDLNPNARPDRTFVGRAGLLRIEHNPCIF